MKKIVAIQFARKRKNATDYRKRLKLLLSGKPRLVVRLSSTQARAQIATFTEKGDKITVAASAADLNKLGWKLSSKNIPAAYLIGFLAGSKAVKAGVKEAIVDAGTTKPEPRGRFYAVVKGAIDAGLTIPVDDKILPADERVSGTHIASYLEGESKNFSKYKKDGIAAASISKSIEEIKSKIQGGQ